MMLWVSSYRLYKVPPLSGADSALGILKRQQMPTYYCHPVRTSTCCLNKSSRFTFPFADYKIRLICALGCPSEHPEERDNICPHATVILKGSLHAALTNHRDLHFLMRITNPPYLYFGMPFGTSRRAEHPEERVIDSINEIQLYHFIIKSSHFPKSKFYICPPHPKLASKTFHPQSPKQLTFP
jgi:hypothetical protein